MDKIIKIDSDNDYFETIEFKTIKRLLNEESIEYITDYLRTFLKIQKSNNPNCFKESINSYHKQGKRGIIYVRLSKEDVDKEKGDVSKSILNQLLMLLTYCNSKKIDVVGIFYEEDISGSDFAREEWRKTLLFCELGNTDIYICKTQARFARSIEFVEKYLHKKFIEWNIRFLSIVDNIDTYNAYNKKSSQITAMVDEWRLEEQSINTKKTLRAKNNAGQWTGSFAPYGYIEDPNDMYHLTVDYEAAKVVREIYSLYANGMGYSKICKYLNERKIPTPSMHKKLQGLKYVCPFYPEGAPYWNTDTIRKILCDKTYDGILIQHRTEKIAYNIKKSKKIPRSEQSIIACAHERIIDPEISKIVREKISNHKKSRAKPCKNGEMHLFSKKVYCGVCGKSFQKNLCKSVAYLHCRNHKHTGGFTCDNNAYIGYDVLEELILKEVNNMVNKYAKLELLEKNYYLEKQKNNYEINLITLQKEKEEINKKIMKSNEYFTCIYQDKASNIISNKEFMLLKEKYQCDINTLNLRLNEINEEIKTLSKSITDTKSNIFEKYIKKGTRHFNILDKFTLDQFISKIVIEKKDENNNRHIKIFWNF